MDIGLLAEENVKGLSSAIVSVLTGTLLTGASFTAVTVMFTVSVSLKAPPDPVLPKSLVTIWILAAPLKLAVGVKLMPLSAALMLLIVPVITIVEFAVPLPVVKLSPVVPLKVIAPLAAVKVT